MAIWVEVWLELFCKEKGLAMSVCNLVKRKIRKVLAYIEKTGAQM
jgi:hypothetical protein